MNCELHRLRKELDELQKLVDRNEKRIEFYEKYGCKHNTEHDSILNSVEKMRGIRNKNQ